MQLDDLIQQLVLSQEEQEEEPAKEAEEEPAEKAEEEQKQLFFSPAHDDEPSIRTFLFKQDELDLNDSSQHSLTQ